MEDVDTRPRLLIIDDDVKLGRLLRDYLEPLGYSVDLVHDGLKGLETAKHGSYAALILDVMMPGMNGFDLLRELRAHSDVPVLMLTALGDEADRIAGLEVGADDYLPKTFSTRELLARLRAVLRRSYLTAKKQSASRQAPLSVGDLWVDVDARVVTVADKPVALTHIEFEILLSLAKAVGRVKSREQLLLEIAERDFEAFDRSIDVHISSLRRKLGDAAKTPRYIETIRSVGYRMRKPGGDE